MKDFLEVFKSIFSKIGDFFDIFDLSFFISGVASAGALFFWIYLGNAGAVKDILTEGNIFIVIIGCYVVGLISFSSGRFVRMLISKPISALKKEEYYARLKSIFISHNLHTISPYKEYLNAARDENGNMMRLYIRLWAEIRQSPELLPSFSLLKRYWVLAATYDGVTFSILLWIVVLILWICGVNTGSTLPPTIGWPVAGFLFIVTIICSREASRHQKNQLEELAATVTQKKALLQTEAGSGK